MSSSTNAYSEGQTLANRGGRREGAGRPSTGRSVQLAVRVSEEAVAKLTEEAIRRDTSKNAVVDELLRGL